MRFGGGVKKKFGQVCFFLEGQTWWVIPEDIKAFSLTEPEDPEFIPERKILQ